MEQNRKIQAKAQKSYQEKTRHSKATAIVLVLLVTFLMLVGGLYLGKRIVRPLNAIILSISKLQEGNLEF